MEGGDPSGRRRTSSRDERYRSTDGGGADGSSNNRGSKADSASSRGSRESLLEFAKRNISYILSVVAVVAIVTMMILFIRGCAPQEPQGGEEVEDAVYTNPYDWSNLQYVNGRLAYVVDGQVKSRLGIDVSDHQQDIDWDAVAADGIDFAIIRLGYRGSTEGELYLDERFEENIAAAEKAGIDCGVYFFSQACTVEEAIEEAEFVLDNLGGATLKYPIAFDSEHTSFDMGESRISGLSQEEMTAIAKAFCDRIGQAGYRTMVYVASYDLPRYVYDDMAARTLWWAEYDETGPAAEIGIALWQYASDGIVAGVSTGVDMNLDLAGALN